MIDRNPAIPKGGSKRRGAQVLLCGLIACPSPSSATSSARAGAPEPGARAQADPAAAPVAIAGEYRYAGGAEQRQQLLDAIEDVVAEMNFIARPIARKRLRESNEPSAELHLLVTETQITVVRPGRPTVAAPRDGTTIVWESPEGDEFEVRHRLQGERGLVQEFVGKGNRSENVFSLAEDGSTVTAQTTITADALPKALRFRMTYQRKPKG